MYLFTADCGLLRSKAFLQRLNVIREGGGALEKVGLSRKSGSAAPDGSYKLLIPLGRLFRCPGRSARCGYKIDFFRKLLARLSENRGPFVHERPVNIAWVAIRWLDEIICLNLHGQPLSLGKRSH